MSDVVVGYVRLSRDDDKKNYISIENQKALISKYASENNMEVSNYYEDDGVSGYIFDRPSFTDMLDKLEKDEIDVIIAKDLSRIGRNNAKVLLLLDRIGEMDKLSAVEKIDKELEKTAKEISDLEMKVNELKMKTEQLQQEKFELENSELTKYISGINMSPTKVLELLQQTQNNKPAVTKSK